MSEQFLEEYGITKIPFPPAAAGIPGMDPTVELHIPDEWKNKINDYYRILSQGEGPKAFPIIGDYGSGKTVLLKGYLKDYFEKKHIKTFYFENPGTKFYDLANELMRNIGRYEFSKAIWELSKDFFKQESQRTLFQESFSDYLNKIKTKKIQEEYIIQLQKIIQNIGITKDEEIAYKLATIVIETGTKPYFEYKDFTSGRKGSLVSERHEDEYFLALINAISKIYDTEGVAFLIDEFEDVAISKRMSRISSYEYLSTVRNLIEISEKGNIWIVMAMTEQAAEITNKMNPALWQRFTNSQRNALKLNPLDTEDAKAIYKWWLQRARKENQKDIEDLYPFSEEIFEIYDSNPNLRYPRKLVKMGFYILSKAVEQKISAPIDKEFAYAVLKQYYPDDLEKI